MSDKKFDMTKIADYKTCKYCNGSGTDKKTDKVCVPCRGTGSMLIYR